MKLTEISELFEKKGYAVSVEPATEISPEQLLLMIDQDHPLRLSLLEDEGNLQFLQFFILFPFQVRDKCFDPMARLIMSINATFDLGGFGIIERDHLVYYRYMYVWETFSQEVLETFFDSIVFLVETFAPGLKAVALGQKTVEQLQYEAKNEILKQEFQSL